MSHDTLDPDEARHRLYDIMRTDAPFDQKAEQALELGKAYLDVDHAHLTRINPHTDYWKAIASTDSEEGRFPTGLVTDLQTTYCRRTIQDDDSIAVHDAPTQGWADDPAFDTHGLHCYHGTPITIDDDTYGTVCFVSETPREPFTDGDTMFAELIARMLEHELERSHHDAELTRRSNLINVLNRVLRHNLRNTMSIIRGRAQLIADQYDDDASNIIIDHSDRLIDLSEKARKLESVLVNEGDRQETDLQTLLTQVVRDVAADYPAATITVDVPESVSVAVRPGLRMAVRELVENAAKHAGNDPTITVSVEASPNDVEITISDDGPGLSDIEQQVLTDGIETPLTHGMGLGLWLTYWIVTGHDGTIEATVSEDGTCMRLQLPRDAASITPTDDTHRERTLQRVQDTFRAVFDQAFDAMVITDDDGYIIEANQSAADLFGVSADSLQGAAVGKFIEDDTAIASLWHSSDDMTEKQGTVPIVRGDSTERIVEYATTTNIVPGHHLAIMRDVTEREKRREELLEERAFIDQALDTLNDVFYVMGPDGGLRRWNQRFRDVTGYDDETLADMEAIEFFPEADRERIADAIEETVAGGDVTVEAELLTADGERIPHEFSGARLIDTEGNVTGLVGVGRDITERKEREQELEVAETIFQNTQDAVFLIDVIDQQEFRVQRVNDAYEELTGLSNDDIQGLTPRQAVGEEIGSDIEARYRECAERGETIEYPEEIPAGGEDRYWQTKLTPIIEDGTVSKLVGAMRDVTDRVMREQALKRYETVLETIDDGAWVLDADKRLKFANRALVESLPVAREQVEGAPLSAFEDIFADPGAFDTYETLVDDLLAGSTSEGDLDTTLDLPEGDRVVNIRVVPLPGDDGPAGVVGIARDITERKERERDLAVKTRAIEEAPIGITMADASRPDNPLVYANQTFEHLTGYAAEDVCGRNCRFLQGERTDPDTVATIRDAIDAEQSVSVDLRNYRSDGTEFWNQLTVAPVTNEAGDVTHYVGFQQDITARREHERDLSQVEHVLKTVLSTAPGLLWTTDAEGVITRARGAALAHFEFESDEMVGNAVFDVFDAYPTVGEHTARALDGERVTGTLTTGDVAFDVWYGPLEEDDGELVGTVGFAALTNRNQFPQSHD